MTNRIDIAAHLKKRNYSRSTLLLRVIWGGGRVVFRMTPRRGFYGLRNAILRVFGAEIAANVRMDPTVQIMFPWNLYINEHVIIGPRVILYSLGKITIGSNVMISQGAHICAGDHDWRQPNLPLLTSEIVIGPECWICSDAFIGPGSTVNHGAVCGARAVVFGVIEPNTTVVGNPARAVAKR
jgi:putative colanic acid biosynthesis acetyltransferase WcaF